MSRNGWKVAAFVACVSQWAGDVASAAKAADARALAWEQAASTVLGTRERCERYSGLPAGFGKHPYAGMVRVAGGSITLGSTKGYREERPRGEPEQVEPFWIDRTEVTNAQFAAFVDATDYRTAAERDGWAPVFEVPSPTALEERPYAWWSRVDGANWRHPAGPATDLRGRANHPVVQVAYEDALAYARWLGRSLPTEAQWEFAAKANRSSEALHHEPRNSRGIPTANFWQGEFPVHDERQDGFHLSAPVGCFPGNPFGLFDSLGNVWEWTRDAYTASHEDHDASEETAGCSAPAADQQMVIKGGSFLCSKNFCARYRVAARHDQEAGQPTMHLGFRTVRAAE